MNKDLEHLKILSICYYISAGITALFSCFPFVHLFVGIALVTVDFPTDGKNPPPTGIGWFFIILASFFILFGWAIAIGTFIAGKRLKQQRSYIFCLVMAGINCAFFPIGTALGIFTFVVLLRDSVKALFNRQSTNFASNSTTPDWR